MKKLFWLLVYTVCLSLGAYKVGYKRGLEIGTLPVNINFVITNDTPNNIVYVTNLKVDLNYRYLRLKTITATK